MRREHAPGKEQRPGGDSEALSNRLAAASSSIPQPIDKSRQRRRIKVVIEGPHAAFVSGWGSRELLMELRGRAPMYSSTARAWATTERVAGDVIAAAERRGWMVDVESYVAMKVTTPTSRSSGGDLLVEDGGLW